jgi:hypothetical protein
MIHRMIRRKRGTVPSLVIQPPVIQPLVIQPLVIRPPVIQRCVRSAREMKCKNEEATRQQGGLFFKGE